MNSLPWATAYPPPDSAMNSLPEARLHSRIAKNSALQPWALPHPPVHLIRLTVSEMQPSMPVDFDNDVSSFSSFSHLPGLPLDFARQAFHSFFFAAKAADIAL